MTEIANRLLPDELENPSVLQIGRLPARSNIIPAQKKAVFYRNKDESAFLRPLNGLYRFYYSPAGDTLPTFCRSDFDRSVFTDTIDVPSMWQYRSYGACSYPNIEYPIPFDPPYVDTACNPVGYYIRDFSVETPAARTILHFAGVDGAFYACRAVLPGMIRQKYGRIVLISSMWGQTGGSCEVAYSAAKAGLIGLGRALAKEEGPSGVTVNIIAPGVIDTDMMASFTDEDRAALAEETPVERLGTAEDVARAIVFLCDENAGYITGQVLGVNGGLVI